MQIIITIPDVDANRVLDNFCLAHNFVTGQGETKPQFARRKVAEWILASAKQGAGFVAQRAAQDALNDVVIT